MEFMIYGFLTAMVLILVISSYKLYKFFTLKHTDNPYEYEIVEDNGSTYEKVVDRYDTKVS
jgi:hypothetical protein